MTGCRPPVKLRVMDNQERLMCVTLRGILAELLLVPTLPPNTRSHVVNLIAALNVLIAGGPF